MFYPENYTREFPWVQQVMFTGYKNGDLFFLFATALRETASMIDS